MPYQSVPGEPVPVAPPTVLSFTDVKVIGCCAVPTALNVPSTDNEHVRKPPAQEPQPLPFTTAPGATVNVTPAGTSTVPSRTSGRGVAGHVPVDASLPPSAIAAPGPEAVFPERS